MTAIKFPETDLVAKDGANKLAEFINSELAETELADAASTFEELLKGVHLKRHHGESIKTWAAMLREQLAVCGRKLKAACTNLSATD